MYKYQDIRVLQIEISNYCNAACPQCPRNYYGGKTMPTLPLRKMSLSDFKKIFSLDLLSNLQQVYFCGTYGDPMTNPHIVEMIQFVKESNHHIEVGIHTNGGIGRAKNYQDLARVVDFIAFGIDGLQDTNHIYRRHVNWQRVMDNCKAFISAGGRAIWDFIVFRHNQHQVESARSLSHHMGFKNFTVKRTGRFLDRAHQYSDSLAVYNSKGFIDYTIAVPTNTEHINENYQSIKFYRDTQGIRNYTRTTKITCNANRIKEVYIGADGFVFPCGWLHDRLYGAEVEGHADHVLIKELMARAGGLTATNVFHASLQNIVDGKWFKVIEKSWEDGNRLERCGIMCGEKINLIGKQNTEVTYKA